MWHILRAVLLLFPRLVWSYFAWILPFSRRPEKHPLSQRYARASHLIRKANKALKVDLVIEGRENIPDEVCCFFSNHLAAADPLMFFEALDVPTTFVAKEEVKKFPFVGRIFSGVNGLFLNRSDLRQQLKVMMKVQDSLMKKEINWVIFPEGTRNRDQMATLLDFHHGTFRAAMRAGVPIVPTVSYGCFRLLDKHGNLKKYPTYIKFLKPLYPEDYEGKTTEDIARLVRSMIQKEVSFNMRKIDLQRMVDLKVKDYRFNKLY